MNDRRTRGEKDRYTEGLADSLMDRQTHWDRETHKNTYILKDRKADRKSKRQKYRNTKGSRYRHTQLYGETDRLTYTKKDRSVVRQKDPQTDT